MYALSHRSKDLCLSPSFLNPVTDHLLMIADLVLQILSVSRADLREMVEVLKHSLNFYNVLARKLVETLYFVHR